MKKKCNFLLDPHSLVWSFFSPKVKEQNTKVDGSRRWSIVETWKSHPRQWFWTTEVPIPTFARPNLPKKAVLEKKMCFDNFFLASNFFFRSWKIESCKSSETRFPKVWGRSEPCSRGKRTSDRRAETVTRRICGEPPLLGLHDLLNSASHWPNCGNDQLNSTTKYMVKRIWLTKFSPSIPQLMQWLAESSQSCIQVTCWI